MFIYIYANVYTHVHICTQDIYLYIHNMYKYIYTYIYITEWILTCMPECGFDETSIRKQLNFNLFQKNKNKQ